MPGQSVPPKLTKTELYRMLAEAVRNTDPQANQRPSAQKPVERGAKSRKRSR